MQKGSLTAKSSNNSIRDSVAAKSLATQIGAVDYEGGYKIKSVKDVLGKDLSYTINYTMMRIDLPVPLKRERKSGFQ